MANQRGRPPLATGTAMTPFSIRLPMGQFDRLCRQAVKEGTSVPELLRRGLDMALEDEGQEDCHERRKT
jgi:hypothetical protein